MRDRSLFNLFFKTWLIYILLFNWFTIVKVRLSSTHQSRWQISRNINYPWLRLFNFSLKWWPIDLITSRKTCVVRSETKGIWRRTLLIELCSLSKWILVSDLERWRSSSRDLVSTLISSTIVRGIDWMRSNFFSFMSI